MLLESFVDEEDDDIDIDFNLLIEVRRIFLMALKGIYMELFEKSQCSPDSLILLT